ncbi:hypothetical protein ACS0TY_017904 [Phlomoides rotata]
MVFDRELNRFVCEDEDPESNTLHQPLLKRNRTLSSRPLAIVGTKVSYIESLDYEINENDLFKQDWRSKSKVEVLQYVFSKWLLAFLVGLLTERLCCSLCLVCSYSSRPWNS